MARNKFSTIEIVVTLCIMIAGLIPILGSMSSGRKSVVGTENRYFGEQYALEIASLLAVLSPVNAKKFSADLTSNNTASPFLQSLAPLKKGFKRDLRYKSTILTDTINGVSKQITFLTFTIDVQIPAMKEGTFQHFFITQMVRDRVF